MKYNIRTYTAYENCTRYTINSNKNEIGMLSKFPDKFYTIQFNISNTKCDFIEGMIFFDCAAPFEYLELLIMLLEIKISTQQRSGNVDHAYTLLIL